MRARLGERMLDAVVLLPFVLTIGWLHDQWRVPFRAFVFGSGSWGFGCILKLVIYHGVIRRLPHDEARIRSVSILNGAVSGVTELGVALAFFAVLGPLTFPEVVAFGVGIGTIEAFLAASSSHPLDGTALEGAARQLQSVVAALDGPRRVLYGTLLPIVERLLAAILHVGSRGLVYVSFHTARVLPFLIALFSFVLADGVLGYRLLHQGRLCDLAVLRRTYLGLACIAAATFVAFLLYSLPGSSAALFARSPGDGR